MYLPEFPSLESHKLSINIKTPKYHKLVKGQVLPRCTVEMKMYQLHVINYFPSIET